MKYRVICAESESTGRAWLSRLLALAIGFSAPLAVSADEYFDWLSSQPEVLVAHAYDNQAEIDADINATDPNNRVDPPVYDSAIGGARWSMSTGISVRDQLRPEFPRVSSGNLLVVWEARWDKRFTGDLGEMHTHKAFQLSRSGSGDNRRIEIRTRFTQGGGSDVAGIDARGYIWDPQGAPMPGQINTFYVAPETWTRFWTLLDFDRRQFSMWVADEKRGAVKLFDRLQFNDMSEGIDNFWFEFNTSQNTGASDRMYIWGRNFAALENVTNVQEVVANGSPVAPNPPKGLSAQ